MPRFFGLAGGTASAALQESTIYALASLAVLRDARVRSRRAAADTWLRAAREICR
jgi:hypothetical protein